MTPRNGLIAAAVALFVLLLVTEFTGMTTIPETRAYVAFQSYEARSTSYGSDSKGNSVTTSKPESFNLVLDNGDSYKVKGELFAKCEVGSLAFISGKKTKRLGMKFRKVEDCEPAQ